MSRAPSLIADAIPLLDVSAYLAGEPAAIEPLAAELRWAFEHVGFYYLRGHGIDRSLIETTYAAAACFHGQPMEKKPPSAPTSTTSAIWRWGAGSGRSVAGAGTTRTFCGASVAPTTETSSPTV